MLLLPPPPGEARGKAKPESWGLTLDLDAAAAVMVLTRDLFCARRSFDEFGSAKIKPVKPGV